MSHAEHIKIESDENGFELHIWVDEDPVVDNRGRMVINVHGVARELLAACQKEIGPWADEGEAVRAEVARSSSDEDEGPWLGETALDYYRRTGNDEALREMADILRKREKEGA